VGSRVGLDEVAKRRIPCLFWESNPDSRARSIVSKLTELPRFMMT